MRWIILGGGPSLRDIDLSLLHGERVIAINEAALTVYPDADIMFYGDRDWRERNIDRLHLYRGGHIVTTDHRCPLRADVYRERPLSHVGLSRDAGTLSGWCSGAKAINLAYHLCALHVVLCGFDMRTIHGERNFHDMHPEQSDDIGRFLTHANANVADMTLSGVRVTNTSPLSQLTCSYAPLDEALQIRRIA